MTKISHSWRDPKASTLADDLREEEVRLSIRFERYANPGPYTLAQAQRLCEKVEKIRNDR